MIQIVLLIGYVVNKSLLSKGEFIAGIVIGCFLILSIFMIFCKYRKRVIGFEDDKEVEELLKSYKQNKQLEQEKNYKTDKREG